MVYVKGMDLDRVKVHVGTVLELTDYQTIEEFVVVIWVLEVQE